MRRRGSTGDLERLVKKRRAMSPDDILFAFVESRLSNDDVKSAKQMDIGRKLSVLAQLPLSDLKNPRLVEVVNRISIDVDNVLHDSKDEDYIQTSLHIHPYPHLIIVEKSDTGRFNVTIRRQDILSSPGYDARHHADPNTTGFQEIFATVGLDTVECDPAKWTELETACFGPNGPGGGSSFLLRCLIAVAGLQFNPLDYNHPADGYLCYPFFREFRSHLTRTLRECLGRVLIPEVVNILVDYSSPPFERQKPNKCMRFKQYDKIHEYFVPRLPKPKK